VYDRWLIPGNCNNKGEQAKYIGDITQIAQQLHMQASAETLQHRHKVAEANKQECRGHEAIKVRGLACEGHEIGKEDCETDNAADAF
jgi:hypothetical protein